MRIGTFVGTFVSASVLALLLGFTVLVSANNLYAQDQRDEAKPQQDAHPDAARPDDAKPAQGEEKPAPDEHAKPAQQNDRPQPNDDKSRTDNNDRDRDNTRQQNNNAAQQGAAQHGSQPANMAQRGNRIPDDKFRANFGRQHTFVIHTTVVGGRPQFQYGGYSFILVDPWPMGWAYTDQCYIDYIDGQYFLFDLLHPGVRIAIMVG